MNEEKKGWGKPGNSRKWHYFNNESTSLCGRWGFYFGYLEEGSNKSPDNCAECKRRYKKLIGVASNDSPEGDTTQK